MVNVMRIHTDRFETVLPKGRFFTPPVHPPKKALQSPRVLILSSLALLALGTLLGLSLPVVTNRDVPRVKLTPPATSVDPTPVPTPAAPPRPLPVHRLPVPAPVQPLDAPRAKLVHVRPIGSIMRVQMPDGRVLTTRYMGELASPGNLPTRGGQLGDEWYTRSDDHCWVMAPVTEGSQSVGWVDP
jgi:hypothetical protein